MNSYPSTFRASFAWHAHAYVCLRVACACCALNWVRAWLCSVGGFGVWVLGRFCVHRSRPAVQFPAPARVPASATSFYLRSVLERSPSGQACDSSESIQASTMPPPWHTKGGCSSRAYITPHCSPPPHPCNNPSLWVITMLLSISTSHGWGTNPVCRKSSTATCTLRSNCHTTPSHHIASAPNGQSPVDISRAGLAATASVQVTTPHQQQMDIVP